MTFLIEWINLNGELKAVNKFHLKTYSHKHRLYAFYGYKCDTKTKRFIEFPKHSDKRNVSETVLLNFHVVSEMKFLYVFRLCVI